MAACSKDRKGVYKGAGTGSWRQTNCKQAKWLHAARKRRGRRVQMIRKLHASQVATCIKDGSGCKKVQQAGGNTQEGGVTKCRLWKVQVVNGAEQKMEA
eukprot:scaffold137860_cov23-Tisochrysis_lutea.AAC.3